MKKFKANIFETVLASLTLLSLIGLGFYFYDLKNPDTTQDNPFKTYDTNAVIINISISSFISRTIFLITFILLSLETYKDKKVIKIVYLSSALTIGFLQWCELYYGSTFYYGEVRDKQGLMFPILASFMATLVIWKINYSTQDNRNLTIKLIVTGLVNIALYFLWTKVYEPWNLGQS